MKYIVILKISDHMPFVWVVCPSTVHVNKYQSFINSDHLKISDFGLSTVFRHLGKERKLSRKCGTPPYIAPEVFAGLDYHAEPADIWSCGIVLVALLAGGGM